MTNSSQSTCPKCGAPLSEDAPQGLCPKCVLAEAATLPDGSSSPAGRTPPPPIEEIAPHFPELEILELIGAGGMGAVYKARQPKLDRLVALKILSHDLSADPAFAERFTREARVLARLNHPNIVTVFDFGTAGPHCFLLMEFIDGVNLRQAMGAGGFSPAESLALVQDICTALAFAHEEGILHRDIKPENVLIDSRGRVKIADFGIAKLVGEEDRNLVTLTMQGSVLGSPHYMAPEQIETPADVDQRADIYSLGVVFYELLTGELPLGRFAPPSEKATMDPRVDEVVMRTLEKERQSRYQTAGEVRTQVEAITRTGAGAPTTTQPAAVSTPAGQPAESGTARFATASAILTGISLAVGVPVLIVISWMFLSLQEQPSVSTGGTHASTGLTFMAILIPIAGILVWAVPAGIGLILGTIALADIRRSEGRKTGLGRALFGTLTWPIILIVALTGLLMPLIMRMTGLGMGGDFLSILLLIAVTLVIGCAASLLLVWAVLRWVKQEPVGMHPALGVTAVVTLFLLAPPSLLVLMNFTAADPGMEDDFGMSDTRGVSSTSLNSSIDSANIKSEIELDFVAPAGRLTMFALLKPWDSNHQPPSDWYVVAPDAKDLRGTIKIGKVGSPVIDGNKHTKVAATLHDSKGNVKASHTTTIPGDQEINLPPEYPVFNTENPSPDTEIKGVKHPSTSGPLDLTQSGVHFIVLAGPAGSKLDSSLHLLAWSVPRPGADPGPNQQPAPVEARVGPVSPPDIIDNWVRHRLERLRKQKPELLLDDVATVDEVEGTIRARSGLMFDTRERTISGKSSILRNETLFLKKGSKATVYPDPETAVRIGPQPEDGMLGFPMPHMWFLTPFSGLRAQVETMNHGATFEIMTSFGGTLRISRPTAFQLTNDGRLEVWDGELEVIQQDGEKTTVVESGQQFQFPELPESSQDWEASAEADMDDKEAAKALEILAGPEAVPTSDPAIDRAVEQFLATTGELVAMLKGVSDGESARKIAPKVEKLAKTWDDQGSALDAPAFAKWHQKHHARVKEQVGALMTEWIRLREDREVAEHLQPVLDKIGDFFVDR